MSSKYSEMDTVVKKILPYLRHRGYDVEKDLDFETPLKLASQSRQGYVDIVVIGNKRSPQFLIEAKKDTRNLTSKDRDQALAYGETLDVPFVVVTNGRDIRCFNVSSSELIRWDGKPTEKIPTKAQIRYVLSQLRTTPLEINFRLSAQGDDSLPFRPALARKQLDTLFQRCHKVCDSATSFLC